MTGRSRSHGHAGGGEGDEPEFKPLRPRAGRGRAGSIRQAEESVGDVSRAGRAGTGAPRGTSRPGSRSRPASETPQGGAGVPGRKPKFGEPGAAEWRYERYRQKALTSGKPESEILSFEDYKRLHYDQAAAGQRPGRSGGPAQVAAKQHLADNYGVEQVENVNLGGKFPDGVRPNDAGGTDYFEVGGSTQGGLPEARERAKLAQEHPALGPNDTLQFVDKHHPDEENWIKYGPGDDPHTKRRP